MNIVFIVPTGVGAEIGGHAGDATPAARLIGSVCDRIILHPNVVNASDINEMPPNSWYVDGNMLDRFLAGDIGLLPVRSNKVLVALNPPSSQKHLAVAPINAVSACRATLGVDAEIVVLDQHLILQAHFDERGLASGTVIGTDALIRQVQTRKFDALAIITEIEIDQKIAQNYFERGGVNPWGAVEAMACRPISAALKCPVAHAPIDNGQFPNWPLVSDPRIAAELVSVAYLFCVIKGLHTAPRWTKDRSKGMWVDEVDLLVSPDMAFGTPHKLCLQHRIPILVVEENQTILPPAPSDCIRVANYVEAAGWIACMRAGIAPQSVCRPLPKTTVI